MVSTELSAIVDSVLRRAQRQGYVVPSDIRQELSNAGLPDAQWKEVLGAARDSLHYRKGRYYCIQTVSPRLQEQQSQQQIVFHAVSNLIKRHKASKTAHERRGQDRIDFIYPVKIRTEDDREFHVLTRDISPTGIRLLASRSLLGQKVRVHLATTPGREGLSSNGSGCTFVVRILWTCAVGDDLFENGGAFLSMDPH